MPVLAIYLVITPLDGWVTDGRNSWIFLKFGVTENLDEDTIRSGYTTHNPSILFAKQEYDTNVREILHHGDLGRAYLKVLIDKGFKQVGRTEWVDGANRKMIDAIYKWFVETRDVRTDKTNVENRLHFLASITGE
mgnify:CR=1 FL=1|jgi:hypothetical protein